MSSISQQSQNQQSSLKETRTWQFPYDHFNWLLKTAITHPFIYCKTTVFIFWFNIFSDLLKPITDHFYCKHRNWGIVHFIKKFICKWNTAMNNCNFWASQDALFRSESQLFFGGGYQGDFSLRSNWPRGLCLIKCPHSWGKSLTLLHPFYNPPGWPGGLPMGQVNDMCTMIIGNVLKIVAKSILFSERRFSD